MTRWLWSAQHKSHLAKIDGHCLTNWGKLELQIGAAFFYYKLGQRLLQIGAASLLKIGAAIQIRATVITK